MKKRKGQKDFDVYVGSQTRRKRPRRGPIVKKPQRQAPPAEHHDDPDPETDKTTESDPGQQEPQMMMRRPGRPPLAATMSNHVNSTRTPKAKRRADPPETPSRVVAPTPSRRMAADRSARKKSVRAMIERLVTGEDSEDEDMVITREIYDCSDEDQDEAVREKDTKTRPAPTAETRAEAEPDREPQTEATVVASTPTPKRQRGRPRGTGKLQKARQNRPPSLPREIPPHERYFLANKPGMPKTSNNSLANLELLNHDEFFNLMNSHRDRHADEIEHLQSIHVESFPQWLFELSAGFSLCAYGYGSKRHLLSKFAKYVHEHRPDPKTHKIVIINGYVRNLSLRDILITVALAADPGFRLPASGPMNMMQGLKDCIDKSSVTVTLVINSIDSPGLRKTGTQQILAHLAAHEQIRLICSADTSDFAMLWDSGLRSSFNFVFHDATTFVPFGPEMDPVDDVHELLGRKTRRVGGKDGVVFVLRSLPENARSLFRLLVLEVLVSMEESGVEGSAENMGIEYRMLYRKAEEEFVCSNDVGFRTLLKESVFRHFLPAIRFF